MAISHKRIEKMMEYMNETLIDMDDDIEKMKKNQVSMFQAIHGLYDELDGDVDGQFKKVYVYLSALRKTLQQLDISDLSNLNLELMELVNRMSDAYDYSFSYDD